MLEIISINTSDEVQDKTLRKRAMSAKNDRSKEFIVASNNAEIALLSYEDWSEISLGFVYEIFVITSSRHTGVGTYLLSYAEELAVKLRCTRIRLKPYALDKDTDQNRLVAWYAKMGYVRDAINGEEMEKKLVTVSI